MERHSVAAALRTIVVTTRAAVRTHQRSGDEEAARASANRGLALLEAFELDWSPRTADVHQLIREARQRLEEVVAEPLRPMGPGASEETAAPLPPRTGRRLHEARREGR